MTRRRLGKQSEKLMLVAFISPPIYRMDRNILHKGVGLDLVNRRRRRRRSIVAFTLWLLLFCLNNHSLVDISRAMHDRSVKRERFL